MFADVEGIKRHSLEMGAGEDLYTLFASVLTMRPWRKVIAKSIDHLQFSTTKEDVNEIQVDNLELHPISYLQHIIPPTRIVQENSKTVADATLLLFFSV